MPKAYDFMKSSRDKEMSDDEYKSLREEYDKKSSDLSDRIRKIIYFFLAIYAVSFAAIYIISTVNKTMGNYTWLALGFLLVIFLYDPKAEDDKKQNYETDKKILLNSVKNKINMSKIRLGLVIFFGVIFIILSVYCWWAVYVEISDAPASAVNSVMLLIAQIPYRYV